MLARLLASVTALTLVGTALPAPAHAGESAALSEDEVLYSCGKPKGKFAVNFQGDLDVKSLVTWAMGFTCKKFLYATSIAGRTAKVTLVTPGKLTASEAWQLFQAALHSMQLAVVPKGAALEIVESSKAKDEALTILESFPDGGAEVVRLLLRPTHVAVEDLRGALDLVKSQHGTVVGLSNLHAILITDDARHISRMKTLVEELDRPAGSSGIYAIPLRHVDAAGVLDTIKQLVGEIKLVAEPRSNALFVSGSAADFAQVQAVARAIDQESDDAARIHRIELRHAKAAEVAAALSGLLAEATLGEGRAKPDATVKVAADEPGNALLVLASSRDAAALRGLVDEMDAPRKQVYIEAVVLELDTSNNRDLGASWHGTKDGPTKKSSWVGSFKTDLVQSVVTAESLASADSGLIAGLLGPSLKLLGQSIPSFGLLVKAHAHRSNLDVLASPHLLTIDNQQAKLSVGSNIPYKASGGALTAAGVATEPNIERENLALTLAITPHVAPSADGESDVIRLDIKLESKALGSENFGDDLGPTWKERSLETAVVLRDEESVVLGGLIDERVEDQVTGIPLLMDLPLLGGLFRSTKKVRSRSNLLVILTPYVVEDSAGGRAILERRMRERDEFLRAADDLDRRVIDVHVDYRKRRGLLADIDAQVEAVERERAELDALRAKPRPLTEGKIEVEVEAP